MKADAVKANSELCLRVRFWIVKSRRVLGLFTIGGTVTGAYGSEWSVPHWQIGSELAECPAGKSDLDFLRDR